MPEIWTLVLMPKQESFKPGLVEKGERRWREGHRGDGALAELSNHQLSKTSWGAEDTWRLIL